jgi:hypothetical protein
LREQLRYNLRSRWFVGFGIEDPIWECLNALQVLGAAGRSRFGSLGATAAIMLASPR